MQATAYLKTQEANNNMQLIDKQILNQMDNCERFSIQILNKRINYKNKRQQFNEILGIDTKTSLCK